MTVEKAMLRPKSGATVTVDFNPQTLRLNYRTLGNQGTENAKDRTKTQSTRTQPTGYTAGLSVELIFDTTETGGNVRGKTSKIADMIQAQDQGTAPQVDFHWGDFLFTGTIQSMDETLEYFSGTGVPLRATVSLSMAGNKPDLKQSGSAGAGFSAGINAGISAGAGGGISAGLSGGFSAGAAAGVGVGAVGTVPLTLAQAGDTLQGLSGRAGVDWKVTAALNGIDNPRLVQPGTVLNLNAQAAASVSLG